MRLIILIITLALLTPAIAAGATPPLPRRTPPWNGLRSAPIRTPPRTRSPPITTSRSKAGVCVRPCLTVDSLGRPFPDPALLKQQVDAWPSASRYRVGVTLTLVGLNTATAIARGTSWLASVVFCPSG